MSMQVEHVQQWQRAFDVALYLARQTLVATHYTRSQSPCIPPNQKLDVVGAASRIKMQICILIVAAHAVCLSVTQCLQ